MAFLKKPYHISLISYLVVGLYLILLFINQITNAQIINAQITNAQTIKCEWPLWNEFKKYYITDEGRVIDPSNGLNITTSEGQSYGLFFALVANDPATFARLLAWTENNLAAGSLAKNLPAWLWGRQPLSAPDSKNVKLSQSIALEAQKWQILDQNSAMDADLWIAYSLLEAGRLWHKPKYIELGKSLLKRVRLDESMKLPKLGDMLLPGKVGFSHVTQIPEKDNSNVDKQDNNKLDANQVKNQTENQNIDISRATENSKNVPVASRYWRLNPSYTPPQLLARFQSLHPVWKQIMIHNQRMLIEGAPTGLAPDWLIWDEYEGFKFDNQHSDNNQPKKAIGGYDAIRVYLWIGMMAEDDPNKKILLDHYSPMLKLMTTDKLKGLPPEKINVIDQLVMADYAGPIGFSAALLPFLQQEPALLEIQRRRLENQPINADAYYTSVLRLFGQGFDAHYYRFNRQGKLIPAWSYKCDKHQ